MKFIESKNKVGEIIDIFPISSTVLKDFGINQFDSQWTLVELALKSKVPLQILLNNLSKKIGIPVKWPKVDGVKNDFGASTGLRSGRPAGVKKIIAVHSGKGGVGKTFIATGLAIFMQKKGVKCGILDLDIDCPNVYKTLEMNERAITNEEKKIIPLDYQGVKVLSMGAIQDREDMAIMWRGPILAKAIDQLIYDTNWGELDLLIIDLPPGTGDTPLTVFNMFKPDKMLIITTPHYSALIDAEKSMDMCRTLGVEISGVVGNMVGDIFGKIDRNWIKKQKTNLLTEISLKKEYNKAEFWRKEWSEEINLSYKMLAQIILG